jgi:hypothetical protein
MAATKDSSSNRVENSKRGRGKAEEANKKRERDFHPSWQLAKAKKLAQKRQLAGMAGTKGKKIVFD